jgi:hypothetical protein
MKVKFRQSYLVICVVAILMGLFLYSFLAPLPPPQDLAQAQLNASALSSKSVWDQEYLNQNALIKEKISEFEKGTLCKALGKLDTKNLTHREISNQMKNLGYKCEVRPLAVNPKDAKITYLKVDQSITDNPHEVGVARQEVCYDQAQPECVIRIKRDGFPRNRRSAPHSTKAIMIDGKEDPGSYDNEAFKIGVEGQAIPKGPSEKVGLRKCPYHNDKGLCDQWMDFIMNEAHPMLKEAPTNGLLNP